MINSLLKFVLDSKTTFVTVNLKPIPKMLIVHYYSKTTFVTVNLHCLLLRILELHNSKTTFVTVNLKKGGFKNAV